jgi:hypothetical protein
MYWDRYDAPVTIACNKLYALKNDSSSMIQAGTGVASIVLPVNVSLGTRGGDDVTALALPFHSPQWPFWSLY